MTNKKPREAEEVLDRLSDLPDHIIHRILQFLDLQFTIQTCVLSTRWKRLWASLPNLTFHPLIGSKSSAFSTFVTEVLSRRDGDCDIGLLQFCTRWTLDQSLLDMVVNYAVSHRVQDLYLSLDSIQSLSLPPPLFNCESLKSLDVNRFKFKALPGSFGFGFNSLTILDLLGCWFCYVGGENIIGDPFANCPNLSHLCLRNCKFSSIELLKITGLQLINLEIHNMGYGFSALPNGCRVEIFGPKLKNFWFENSYPVDFYRLYLPSLKRLEISTCTDISDKIEANLNLVNMFQKLRNAITVWLHRQTFEVLDWFPELLKQKGSPFKKLMCFQVPCNLESFTIPAHVAAYFLGSTNPAEPTGVEYQKIGKELVRVLSYQVNNQGYKPDAS